MQWSGMAAGLSCAASVCRIPCPERRQHSHQPVSTPTRGAGVSKLNSSCFWLVVMHAALVCLVITVAQLFEVVRQAWAAVSVALHLVVAWPAVTRSTTQERCL